MKRPPTISRRKNDVQQGLFPQAAHVRHLDNDEAHRFACVVESSIQEFSAQSRDTRARQTQGKASLTEALRKAKWKESSVNSVSP